MDSVFKIFPGVKKIMNLNEMTMFDMSMVVAVGVFTGQVMYNGYIVFLGGLIRLYGWVISR
jgi:uncharacterized membrane protein YcaP (DUF421 family)